MFKTYKLRKECTVSFYLPCGAWQATCFLWHLGCVSVNLAMAGGWTVGPGVMTPAHLVGWRRGGIAPWVWGRRIVLAFYPLCAPSLPHVQIIRLNNWTGINTASSFNKLYQLCLISSLTMQVCQLGVGDSGKVKLIVAAINTFGKFVRKSVCIIGVVGMG